MPRCDSTGPTLSSCRHHAWVGVMDRAKRADGCSVHSQHLHFARSHTTSYSRLQTSSTATQLRRYRLYHLRTPRHRIVVTSRQVTGIRHSHSQHPSLIREQLWRRERCIRSSSPGLSNVVHQALPLPQSGVLSDSSQRYQSYTDFCINVVQSPPSRLRQNRRVVEQSTGSAFI